MHVLVIFGAVDEEFETNFWAFFEDWSTVCLNFVFGAT